MKKIKDIISKPSEALQAMVDGLIDQNKREDFIIDMSDFGSHRERICYGCAATCAIQKITQVNLTWENILSIYNTIGLDGDGFEWDMDEARRGSLHDLFTYFGIDTDFVEEELLSPDFFLQTHNWEEQIPVVREHITLLQENGY